MSHRPDEETLQKMRAEAHPRISSSLLGQDQENEGRRVILKPVQNKILTHRCKLELQKFLEERCQNGWRHLHSQTLETGRILASIYYNAMLYQKGNEGPESLSELLLVKKPSDNDGTA